MGDNTEAEPLIELVDCVLSCCEMMTHVLIHNRVEQYNYLLNSHQEIDKKGLNVLIGRSRKRNHPTMEMFLK